MKKGEKWNLEGIDFSIDRSMGMFHSLQQMIKTWLHTEICPKHVTVGGQCIGISHNNDGLQQIVQKCDYFPNYLSKEMGITIFFNSDAENNKITWTFIVLF